jgi:hypothetical protein
MVLLTAMDGQTPNLPILEKVGFAYQKESGIAKLPPAKAGGLAHKCAPTESRWQRINPSGSYLAQAS